MEFLKDIKKWKPSKTSKQTDILKDQAETTKEALGIHTPIDETKAAELLKEALNISKNSNKLNDAADLLEQAFLRYPDYKEKYEYLAKLWRKGISR